jgi:hypothetical protein
MSFSDNNKLFIASTTTAGAAGTTLITSGAVDTAGFGGCCFIVPLGALVTNAVTSLKVQQSSDDAATDDYTDVTGTAQTIADTDDDKLKYVDVVRPGKRYLKLLVSRGTQNATIGGIVAVLYNSRSRPVTHGTGVAGETFVLPVEGTA